MRIALLAVTTAMLMLAGAGAGSANEATGPIGGFSVAASGGEDPVAHERSVACSLQADQKGLQGKARKAFRSACIRDKS